MLSDAMAHTTIRNCTANDASAALRSESILTLLNLEEALNKHWNSCVEAVKQVVTAVASLGISLVASC